MSAHNDGGPVFSGLKLSEAFGGLVSARGSEFAPLGGMTLRDYFAAKAMQGMLADSNFDHSAEKTAELSYAMADAMLKERQS